MMVRLVSLQIVTENIYHIYTNNRLPPPSSHKSYSRGKPTKTTALIELGARRRIWKMIKERFSTKQNLKNWQQFAASYFLGGKQPKKVVFSTLSGGVLLVSDFNQNRFDRFIFEGDIPHLTIQHITRWISLSNIFSSGELNESKCFLFHYIGL